MKAVGLQLTVTLLVWGLPLWACSGKNKPAPKAQSTGVTCSLACDHLTAISEEMIADMVASGATHTQTGDPQEECMKLCESGQLIAQCAAASHDLFTANLCSKEAGEEVDLASVMLLVAATEGDAVAVERLLSDGADANYVRHQTVALGAAIVAGNAEIVRMLVAAKANVNFMTERTRISLLQTAVIHDHPEIVSILLAAGADIAHKDNTGTDVLENAVDRPDILKLLNEQSAK